MMHGCVLYIYIENTVQNMNCDRPELDVHFCFTKRSKPGRFAAHAIQPRDFEAEQEQFTVSGILISAARMLYAPIIFSRVDHDELLCQSVKRDGSLRSEFTNIILCAQIRLKNVSQGSEALSSRLFTAPSVV